MNVYVYIYVYIYPSRYRDAHSAHTSPQKPPGESTTCVKNVCICIHMYVKNFNSSRALK